MRNKLKITKTDIVISAIVPLAALAFLVTGRLSSGDGHTATVRQDGEILARIDLRSHKNEVLEYGNVKIEIKDGAIGFIDSPCYSKDCIKTGFISRAGQTAVCLPEKTVITISGKTKGPDAITY